MKNLILMLMLCFPVIAKAQFNPYVHNRFDTNADSVQINGNSLTNLPIVWDFPTNIYSGFNFQLGTNLVVVSSTNIGFSGVANLPSAGGRSGQLLIISTGSITITNPVSWHSSDNSTTRSITSGQSLGVIVDVLPGIRTNAAMTLYP